MSTHHGFSFSPYGTVTINVLLVSWSSEFVFLNENISGFFLFSSLIIAGVCSPTMFCMDSQNLVDVPLATMSLLLGGVGWFKAHANAPLVKRQSMPMIIIAWGIFIVFSTCVFFFTCIFLVASRLFFGRGACFFFLVLFHFYSAFSITFIVSYSFFSSLVCGVGEVLNGFSVQDLFIVVFVTCVHLILFPSYCLMCRFRL